MRNTSLVYYLCYGEGGFKGFLAGTDLIHVKQKANKYNKVGKDKITYIKSPVTLKCSNIGQQNV